MSRTIESYKQIQSVIPITEVTAYSGFTNQPANDDIELISDSSSDTQLITLLYLDNSDVLQQVTTTMNGVTQVVVASAPKPKTLLGAFLGDKYGNISKRAVGTITIREASGNATITTITAGKLATGVQRFYMPGKNVTLENISGNTWFDSNNTIPSTTGAFGQMSGRMNMTLNVTDYLTLISDGSGSTAQIYIYA